MYKILNPKKKSRYFINYIKKNILFGFFLGGPRFLKDLMIDKKYIDKL